MQYNLSTPISGSLPYPHYTKMDRGVAYIVTHPERLIKVGDTICFNDNLSTIGKPHTVLAIVEKRKARGQHSVDFVPVFQKLKTKLV